MNKPGPASGGRRMRLPALVLIATLAAVIGVASLILAASSTSQPSPAPRFAGPVFATNLRAVAFSLTDQDGRRVTLSQYRGQVVVLSFMYSHCRDACPLMATEIRGALDELPHGLSVPVLAVSVDAAHDTPASARAFLAREHMTGRMRFLLGPPEQLRRVWKRYGIQPHFDRSGRRYRGGHSAYVMLIDRHGLLRVGFPASQLVPEDLAHDIKLLLGQRQ